MIRDARWRACHLQRRLRPGLSILDRKSVHGSRAACGASLDGYSTWLSHPLTPRSLPLPAEIANPEVERTKSGVFGPIRGVRWRYRTPSPVRVE